MFGASFVAEAPGAPAACVFYHLLNGYPPNVPMEHFRRPPGSPAVRVFVIH